MHLYYLFVLQIWNVMDSIIGHTHSACPWHVVDSILVIKLTRLVLCLVWRYNLLTVFRLHYYLCTHLHCFSIKSYLVIVQHFHTLHFFLQFVKECCFGYCHGEDLLTLFSAFVRNLFVHYLVFLFDCYLQIVCICVSCVIVKKCTTIVVQCIF